MGGDGEAKTDGHAAGVAFHWGVEVALAAREVDDLVKFSRDLGFAHAHDGAVHVDILSASELRVEACADFQQGGDPATGTDGAGSWGGDTRQELQQGAFAGTVLADDANDVALLYLEVDVTQCPYVFGVTFGGTVVGLANLEVWVFMTQDSGLPPTVEVVRQGSRGDQSEAVLL